MHGRKIFTKRYLVIQRRSRPKIIIPRMQAAIAQCTSFAYVGPSDWNCLPHSLHLELLSPHLSSRKDDLRLSCLLTEALMPLESIANLSDAI